MTMEITELEVPAGVPDDVPVDVLVHVPVDDAVDALEQAVASFLSADLGQLSAAEELRLVGRLEKVRRRLDAGTDRSVGHLDRSGAFSLDGYKSAKGALKGIGRITGREAHGRVRTARALCDVPLVAAAYERGEIPTAHVRAIVRTVSNPRVAEHVPGADQIFAHHARLLSYDELIAVLREWERLADPDGADQSADETHERRRASLLDSAINGSWSLEATFGPLQGAATAEVFAQFEHAEFLADWAEARERFGADARVEHLARTPAQRRADALFEIFRRAGAAPADARSPEPLVNIIVDQQTFEEELRRAAGEDVEVDPNADLDSRRCHTIDGTPLHPGDALVAALVGHVRRVVLSAKGTVIDLGTKRRLFTGSSRAAVMLQALLRGPGGLGCGWPGCDGRGPCLQAEHREPARLTGPTDIDNSEAFCGFHNRIKERGFRPVRGDDGSWTIIPPDGRDSITPAV